MLSAPSIVLRSMLHVVPVYALALQAACSGSEAGVAALSQEAPASKAKAETARPAAKPLKLRKVAVHDQGIGCTAFTLLVPAEWETRGGVQWQMQYANLASGRFEAFDPKGKAALELFPVIPACWDESGMLGAKGQNYMGSVIYPPPRDALQYVREVFVPLYRANAMGLKVGAATPLPEVARAVERAVQEPSVTKSATAARVRLEYEDGGKTIAEDVFVTIVLSRSPILPNMTHWSLEHQYSFRAEKKDLDALAPVMQTIAASVRLELDWYAGYAQVLDLWRQGQMQSIRDAGELSRRISRNNDAILASMRSSWEARQSAQDRMAREFSEAIRGVETYDQPFEHQSIQLPSGYRDVWVNPRGEYVLSNEAGYDPNVGATQEWRRMQATR